MAQECVDAPDEVAMLSVADLAVRTETSPATVIRTSQNLGFKGFQHLRLLLLRDVGSASREVHVVPSDQRDSSSLVPAVFDAAARDISQALGALDYRQFDQAAEAIAHARRLLIVGNGGSGPAAQMIALRMLTSDRPCEAPADANVQRLTARLLRKDDVCLVISDSGINGTTLQAAEAAVTAGATVVGVTSYARSRLSELATYVLVVGAAFRTWGDGGVTGNIAQILILSALHNAVSRARNAKIGMAPAALDEVLDLVDVDRPDERSGGSAEDPDSSD